MAGWSVGDPPRSVVALGQPEHCLVVPALGFGGEFVAHPQALQHREQVSDEITLANVQLIGSYPRLRECGRSEFRRGGGLQINVGYEPIGGIPDSRAASVSLAAGRLVSRMYVLRPRVPNRRGCSIPFVGVITGNVPVPR